MPHEFTCTHCGGTFVSERSEEEADREYRERFPNAGADRIVVCDDCYAVLIAAMRS
jgi:hypothetical protein